MEERYMKTKKIIIITMCTLICIMAVGYAAFATQLTITGTSNIESTWKVEFTNIEEVSKTSGVTITNTPTASGTTATFDVDLTSPGDNIIYRITVTNNGTLNAIIDNITASESGSDAIKFEITGIKKGDKLASKATSTFDVTISYDNSVTSQPTTTNNKLTVDINYVQDVGQTITSEDVTIEGPDLITKILQYNVSQPDTNIDFSQPSSDTNGKGLYYTSTNTEDNKTTYYFRGAVENNYVTFAGFTWRIIRINEDGSIRLITQDLVGTSAFNATNSDNAYVGYMYGTPGASTYEETHKNTNSSTIKTELDKWYQNNLINYSSLISDSGFCGDRSISKGLGYAQNFTFYNIYTRIANGPQFKCPQTNDLYTTTTSNKGNKSLTYPIGLITADEVIYAGGISSGSNYYLHSGSSYWTMTPYGAAARAITAYTAGFGGELEYYSNVNSESGIRPVINLKLNVRITSGDGTKTNPYTIKTN